MALMIATQLMDHEVLTAEQEQQLGMVIQEGIAAQQRMDSGEKPTRQLRTAVAEGKAARNRFLQANLRLATWIAHKERGRLAAHKDSAAMDLDDYVQVCFLALDHALRKWDPTRGIKFSTYAMVWARQYLQRAVEWEGHLVRIPSDHDAAYNREMRRSYETGEALSSEWDHFASLRNVDNLDRPLSSADGSFLVGDVVASDDPEPFADLLSGDQTKTLVAAVQGILVSAGTSERDIGVWFDRYLNGSTCAEIAGHYGMSASRVVDVCGQMRGIISGHREEIAAAIS